jgi:hypothetical protein
MVEQPLVMFLSEHDLDSWAKFNEYEIKLSKHMIPTWPPIGRSIGYMFIVAMTNHHEGGTAKRACSSSYKNWDHVPGSFHLLVKTRFRETHT